MLEWAYNYLNTLYDIPIPPKVIDCDNIHLGFFPVSEICVVKSIKANSKIQKENNEQMLTGKKLLKLLKPQK